MLNSLEFILVLIIVVLGVRLYQAYKTQPKTIEESKVKEVFKTVMNDLFNATDTVFAQSIDKLRDIVDTTESLDKLKIQISNLKIEKSKIEEDFNRKEREIEHKVGLERTRQAQELDIERKKITVELGLVALEKDRTRFEEQMKFHQDRFEKEISYQRELVEQAVLQPIQIPLYCPEISYINIS